MQRERYIGVDIGTTSTKAAMYDGSGALLAQHHVEYPLYRPEVSAAEQDPEEIFQSVVTSVRATIEKSGVSNRQVGFVSFSSAMHTLIALDEEGYPLTKCITWADSRSAKWADRLRASPEGHEIYRRTGTPTHPMLPLTKLMWLQEEYPETFQKAVKFVSIKEYVFYRLFEEYVIDYSIASATGLFELEKLAWDMEALVTAGITADQLSKPVPTTAILTGLSEMYADAMGLAPDTPFIIGASDGVLSNLGVNAIEPGTVAVTIGTSGAIRTAADRPITDPKGRTFCYVLTEDLWIIGGPVNNGGMTFKWLRDQLCSSEAESAIRIGVDPYKMLTDIASRVRPGSDGLLFHPYLSGERAPLWNAKARGSFFGLALHHQKEHLIRAVLEGVIFNLHSVMLTLEELIGKPSRIQATGGFAQSGLWRQMLTDIFNQEVYVPESHESSCLGAVILGLYAQGKIDSLQHASSMVGSVHHHTPNPENVKLYKELMSIFIRISRKLEEEYTAIADFQRKHVQ
ncbi:gluconokinase [Alkalihalobacillus sp. AL-G]|uniref:gluconokinase n=1 Tax=Alkalihalobacillus sp. AL-G TaxID=2926399 RepID=UPI00272AA28B|nr:gluconokinase [Alkalihalobacillus sp. AL-G]WLD94118.1 gluconokinase [Alkalihalobacillus sp. AL-G]